MNTLLTDEEIEKLGAFKLYTTPIEAVYREVAKAQLKKVVEWGDEVCSDKSHHPRYACMLRHCCLTCWQALLKEVEDE